MRRAFVALAIFCISIPAWGRFPAAHASDPPSPSAQPAATVHTPGRVLVRYKAGRQPATVAESIPGIGMSVVTVAPGTEQDALSVLNTDPNVDFAELDGLVWSLSEPADPLYYLQRWNLQATEVPAAWEALRDLHGPLVAIVDSGVDLTHPDLAGRLVPGYDFLDGDDQSQDLYGHGTHLAGIVAASPNNNIGVAGISPGSRVMPVRVLDALGMGTASNLARGIIWAADHGARIINLSVAAPLGGETLHEAIQYAGARGALIVAAAGNSYMDGNPPIYPASYESVIAVAATNNAAAHASYSSSGSYVDLAAPGGDPEGPNDQDLLHLITSTYSRSAGAAFAALAGTSQAAAHVSGVAALVWTANPSLTAAQVRSILEESAMPLGQQPRDNHFGFGLVNAAAAVEAARTTTGWATRLYFPLIIKN